MEELTRGTTDRLQEEKKLREDNKKREAALKKKTRSNNNPPICSRHAPVATVASWRLRVA